MRTQESFNSAFNSLLNMIKLHKKSYWLVPNETNYFVSVIEPKADELPAGTAAILYKGNFDDNNTLVENDPVIEEQKIESSKRQ